MPHFKIASAFLALLFISIACSKEDYDVPTETCTYLGKSYTSESSYYSSKTTETYNQTIEQTDEHFPTKVSVSISYFEKDTSDNTQTRKSTEETVREYTYDKEGYLIKSSFHQVSDKEGGPKSSFYFESYGPVKKLFTDILQTTDYIYEGGLLKESNYKQTVTYNGDKLPTVTTNSNNKRIYLYDSQKVLTSITATDSYGSKSVTNYVNGLISSLVGTGAGGQSSTTLYESTNGKTTAIKLGIGQINFEYDARGNRTVYEYTQNNQKQFRQEYAYDSNRNPESLIPLKFKGIPEPISSVQSSDDPINNVISYKNLNIAGNNSFTENTNYTYNNNKLPETSTASSLTAAGSSKRKTIYKYGNCM